MNIDSARQNMIEQQVRAWDVFDANCLDVLRRTPREQFVAPTFEALAFADTEIPIGHGQSMMTPTVEGRVLQSLALTGGENVLEIGTGSGYLTACLGRLAGRVTSIDIYPDFLQSTKDKLAANSIDNVTLFLADGMSSLPEGKFDAIAVTGSIQHFDPRLVDALTPGGRLFVVIGDAPAMDARLIRRSGETDWESESLFETVLMPLVNGSAPPQFLF